MQDFINSVRLVITEQHAGDLAHEASVTAHLASHHANTKDAHKKASEAHKIAHARFENLKNREGGKYYGVLMKNHQNMIAYHDHQATG
jgi:hypothetical protein